MKYYLMAFVPEDTGYSIFSPDFKEANTQGDTIEECMEMAMDVLRITVEEYDKEGRDIPEPCNIETAKTRIKPLLHGEYFFQYVPVPEPVFVKTGVCISLTEAEVEEIDFKAKLYGMKRSRFLVAAARAYNPKVQK